MSKLIDLTGRRFGRLLVLGREGTYFSDEGVHSCPTWRCRCDCGAVVVVHGTNLRRGASRSCGCLQRELAAEKRREEARRRHGRVYQV